MPEVHRSVTTRSDPERVYAYLSDFENATEWDSGTVSCERVSGDGGVGTVYRNVSRFLGRTVTLDYTVRLAEFPIFLIVGRTGATTSTDTITVGTAGGGTEVDYRAEFDFGGPARLLGRLLRIPLQRLASETSKTLAAALDRL